MSRAFAAALFFAASPRLCPPRPRPHPTSRCSRTDFVSSMGWVKPGETYPFTLRVINYGATPLTGAQVTLTAPDGTTLDQRADWDAGTSPPRRRRHAGHEGEGVRGHGRHARPGPADRLEEPLEHGDAHLRRRRGRRDTRHGPKVIPPTAATRPRATATARSRSSRSTTPTASTAPRRRATKLAGKINDPEQPRLDAQPLPGDLLRPAVPARRRCRRTGVATAGWGYGRGFALHASPPSRQLPRRHQRHAAGRRLPADRPPHQERLVPAARPTDYYGDDGKGSALIGALPASARCRTSTRAAARPARRSSTPRRSPTRRSTTTTTTPTRTASSTSS